ncbi:MAG: DUF4112 domain-containing protein [Phaeodactylibacter sp.]|nr:DUF4112 domain-containing protein [Phaeodactylibacter sp.]MCB9295042.1 DUF4112 domain-containing protein [Lewinellaceae bacterium]
MKDQPAEQPYQQELAWIDTAASILDNRYRIPGTNIRFGADFLIGLVPYIGDVVSFAISGVLVAAMARKGASGIALVKMAGNVLIDTVVGAVPLLGDLFDLGYRANLRNLRLLREHYAEGKHQGSAWPVVIFILLLLFALLGLSVWLIWRLLYWVLG